MDYWTLRRQIRETAVDVPAPLLVRRFIGMSTGGIGMILVAGKRELCCEIAVDPPKQWLRLTPLWEESEHEPPFARALNRVLKDARLEAWEMPVRDRVVAIRLRNRSSFFGDRLSFSLMIEFTGRISNCLLCDHERLVLEQLRTTGNNRLRSPYVFPGPAGLLSDKAIFPPPPVDAAFSDWGKTIPGFSPLIGREVSFLADQRKISRAEAWSELLPRLEACSEPVCLYRTGEKVVAICAVPMQHLEAGCSGTSFARVNEAFDLVFGEVLSVRLRESLRTQVLTRCARELTAIGEHIAEQSALLRAGAEAEHLKKAGDLILQNLGRIPPYAKTASLTDLETGEVHVLELEPGKTPGENAQRYFHRYKKAKRSKVEIERRLVTLRRREEWLREQQWFCQSAARADELRSLVDVLEDKPVPKPTAGEKRRKLQPTLEVDGCRFYVGKNARQNQNVTFGFGRKGDMWFHALEVPGSHVIARRDGGAFSEADLLLGAQLAAFFSFARQSGKAAVDYTDVAHVRKIPGGAPGQVFYTNQKTLFVNPQEALSCLNAAVETPCRPGR
jgi:predicted ribosome quality control (RQC) complex YloA/Tae2 family protein